MSKSLERALGVLRAEAAALQAVARHLEHDEDAANALDRAVDIIAGLAGHLIVVGIGKSGHIGAKLAASFASTGTPSFFMHPAEASHGDLGMVTRHCALLAISRGGESREMLDVLHYCRRESVPVIALTAAVGSTLGRAADVVLALPDMPEACPNGLAPTTSTTAALALGDALMVAVMTKKGISSQDFGRHHPGGKLGRGLQTVGEWMALSETTPPTTQADSRMDSVILAMSEGREGCVAVLDAKGHMVGMITDGDLRRAMAPDLFSKRAGDIMTAAPFTVSPDQRMGDIIQTLSERRIGTAFVLEDRKPVAVINTKTLMRQGYI